MKLADHMAAPLSNGEQRRIAILADTYLQARMRCARLREELDNAEAQRDALQWDLMVSLDAAQLKSARTEAGLFTIAERHLFSLPTKKRPDARRQALRWLSRVGAKELIDTTIHWQTLNSFLRERLEKALPVHPLIRATTERYLQVRNAKRGAE